MLGKFKQYKSHTVMIFKEMAKHSLTNKEKQKAANKLSCIS